MVDVMSPEKRSALMSRIKGKNTAPEVTLRQILWRKGFRYKLHSRKLPGRPDLVFVGTKIAIFMHGCFWHRHEGCPYFRLPKTRQDFWEAKLQANRKRDLTVVQELITLGWRVGIVWECAMRTSPELTVTRVAQWIEGGGGNICLEACEGPVFSTETCQSEAPY
jgi:DNA mismatch endonuclease (patch repair protein)